MSNPYAPPSGHAPPSGGPAPAPNPPVPAPPDSRQPRSPVPAARKPPPDPKVVQAAGRRVTTFSLLLLASVATNTLPLPWQAASLGFVLAALVVGVRALRFVWRAGLRGLLVSMLAVGLSFTLVLAVAMAGLLAVWPAQLARQHCLRGALTIAATQGCETDFTRAVENRVQRMTKTPTTGS